MSELPPPSGEPSAPPRQDRGFSIGDFLSFRYMITPALVMVIYILGAVGITIVGLITLVSGDSRSGGAVGGLLIILIGNLVWRVYMEIVMLFFRINEGVQRIDRNTRR